MKQNPNHQQNGQNVRVQHISEKVVIVLFFHTSPDQSAMVVPSQHLVLTCLAIGGLFKRVWTVMGGVGFEMGRYRQYIKDEEEESEEEGEWEYDGLNDTGV